MGLGFRADGAELVSVAEDGAIVLWDSQGLAVGRPAGSVKGPVTAVSFSPTGHTLLAQSALGTVAPISRFQLWHLKLSPDQPPRFLPWSTRRALFSPDGSRLAVLGRADLAIEELRGHSASLRDAAFSHDGSADLALWRPDNELIEELRGHSASVRDAVFSHDGSFLAAGDGAGKVILWSLREPRSFGRRLPGNGGDASLSLRPDGTQLAWAAGEEIRLWDVVEERPLPPLAGYGGRVTAVAFSPDGRTLAATDWNVVRSGQDFENFGVLRLWDVASRRPRELVRGPAPFRGLAFSPDGRRLVAQVESMKLIPSGGFREEVVVFDLVGEGPDGPRAESALIEQAIGLAVHPRQNLVAFATGEETIPLVGLDTRSPAGPPLTAPGPVVSVAWSPSGETLATGLEDGRVLLWDLASRQPKGEALAGKSLALSLAFSSGGDLLAAYQQDGDLAIWDVAQGRTLFPPIAGNPSERAAVRFHPQRPLLVSAGEHGPPILWDLDTRTWIRRACEIANRDLTREEWKQYVGREVPYRRTCADLPGPAPR